MFAKPRPKKSILPPPAKKRKTTSSVQEITFDDGARQEYLTGFHKRKLERVKHAQEQAAKQARQERLDARKQLRDQRRREVEEHVETVNRMLRVSGAVVDPVAAEPGDDEAEWGGFPDKPDLDIVDHEEEYVDEDRYTTVTVEAISVSREGLSKPETEAEEADQAEDVEAAHPGDEDREARKREGRPAKIKKKKFRYESKIERQLTNSRQKAKSTRRKQESS